MRYMTRRWNLEVKKAVPRELSAGRTGGAAFGSGRGATYISVYGQGSNSSAGVPCYSASSAGRCAYSSYGLASYGTGAPGYGVPTNGAYGAAAYGGGAGYPPAGVYGAGYGSVPPMTGYGGVTGSGAPINAPMAGPRSPWGGSGAGYAGARIPAAYGAGGAAGMSGYGAPGWNARGMPPQANGGIAGYTNSGYGYGTNDAGHNYAGGLSACADAMGYGVVGRQAQRDPDARLRPYPGAGERVA